MTTTDRRVFITSFAWTFAFLFGLLTGAIIRLHYGLPRPSELQEYRPMVSTKLFDCHGQLIADFAQQRREIVPLSQIPCYVKYGIIAVEDKRFYHHWGIDIVRLFGTAFYNLKNRRVVQGGSTITQQLARNMFLTMEQTFSRKIREALLALEIERAFSKEEILEMYLNQVFFGSGAYGIEAAAQTLYNKHARDLNLIQCATISAIPANPAVYSPYEHPDRLAKRRNLFLKKLLTIKRITKAEYDKATAEPVRVEKRQARMNEAPYFVEEIRKYLEATYGPEFVYTSGATIHTTLDLMIQRAANAALTSSLDSLEKAHNLPNSKRLFDSLSVRDTSLKPQYLQGAVVAIDPKSGGVRAMVGGRSLAQSYFNRAVQAKRQAGSAFKVFVYVAAIDNGHLPDDIEDDSPLRLANPGEKPYEPHNFDYKFMGPVDLYTAFALSRNVVAVKLISEIGPEVVVRYARRMGISGNLPPYYSLALGACDVSPLEMTSAFSVIANYGTLTKPRYINKIVDRNGRVLEENRPQQQDVLSAQTCVTMISMMRGVVDEGTAHSIRREGFKRPAAGKTGTTDDYADAWFVGFTPELACGVWVGYDQRRRIFRGATGGTVCAPIWARVMSASTPPAVDEFIAPDEEYETPSTRTVRETTAIRAHLPPFAGDTTERESIEGF